MKKSILITLAVIGLISCKEVNKSTTAKTENQKKSEAAIIVQKILDVPQIQWMYHPEIEGRIPVKVLETKQIKKGLHLTKFGKKVQILSASDLKNKKGKDCVFITYQQTTKDTLSFKLSYPLEGVAAHGKLIRKGNKWKVLNTAVSEK